MAKNSVANKPIVKAVKPKPAASVPPAKKAKVQQDKPVVEKKPTIKKQKKPVEATPVVEKEEEKEAVVAPKPSKKEPKYPKKPLTAEQKTGIFKKTLVGVSSGACEEGATGEDFTFTQAKTEIQALGAIIAPTIHKRVDMLLVNESACNRNTQKVRKAQKFKVPIVRAQEYITACKEAGKKLPVDDFLASLDK